MKISAMAQSIDLSLTRQLFDRAKQYEDVIDFTLGDPDYPTPERIQKAGCAAITAGKTHYSANAGLLELRQAIAGRIRAESGLSFTPEREIIVTVGAMEALYLSLCCLLDPGDEVLIPAPYWINYRHMVQMCGGTPVIVDTDPDDRFTPRPDLLERAITPKTTAIIINSPNNPTGVVYDQDTVEGLCCLAQKHDLTLLWDECYRSILYDGLRFVSPLEWPNMRERTVLINSCSKLFSMTGWRLGYAAAPQALVQQMTKLQENIAACASLPSQYAAIEAYSHPAPETEAMCQGFARRRDVMVDGLNAIPKLRCRKPEGTFYAMADIRQTGMKSEAFAYRLLDSVQVAVVPGITYGACCEGFVRMAYTMEEKKIQEGLRRMAAFLATLEQGESL